MLHVQSRRRSWPHTLLWWMIAQLLAGCVSTANGQGPPTQVYADVATLESIVQRRMVTGEIRALKRSDVAVEESGVIVELAVREGDRVQAGDVLFRVDNTRLNLLLEEIESELAEASARLEEVRVEAAYWQRELEVQEQASQRGASTDKELRDTRYQANLSNARLGSAERAIDRIRARRAVLTDRFEDTIGYAPFDGVIVQRLTEIGAWAEEGDAAVVLLGTSAHEAWLDVPQGLLPAVNELVHAKPSSDVSASAGDSAEEMLASSQGIVVKVDATGKSHSLSRLRPVPEASRSTRSFTLAGIVDAQPQEVIAGGSVVAFVPTGDVRETLTVSKDAVLRGPSGSYVMIVRPNEDGSQSAFPASITVLFETELRVAVAPGPIGEGDFVVTEGAERLRPGAGVMILEPPTVSPDSESQKASAGSTTSRAR